MADTVKQLKIKTGSVGRLRKELSLYKEEEAREQENVHKLKAAGADQHDIKHAVRVSACRSSAVLHRHGIRTVLIQNDVNDSSPYFSVI